MNSAWDTVHLLREDYLHTSSFCKCRRKPAPLKSFRVLLIVQTADSGCARYRHRTILEVHLSQGTMTTWIVRGTPGLSFWQPQVDNRIWYLVLQVYVTDDHGDHRTMSNDDVQDRRHLPSTPFQKASRNTVQLNPVCYLLEIRSVRTTTCLSELSEKPFKILDLLWQKSLSLMTSIQTGTLLLMAPLLDTTNKGDQNNTR